MITLIYYCYPYTNQNNLFKTIYLFRAALKAGLFLRETNFALLQIKTRLDWFFIGAFHQ